LTRHRAFFRASISDGYTSQFTMPLHRREVDLSEHNFPSTIKPSWKFTTRAICSWQGGTLDNQNAWYLMIQTRAGLDHKNAEYLNIQTRAIMNHQSAESLRVHTRAGLDYKNFGAWESSLINNMYSEHVGMDTSERHVCTWRSDSLYPDFLYGFPITISYVDSIYEFS